MSKREEKRASFVRSRYAMKGTILTYVIFNTSFYVLKLPGENLAQETHCSRTFVRATVPTTIPTSTSLLECLGVFCLFSTGVRYTPYVGACVRTWCYLSVFRRIRTASLRGTYLSTICRLSSVPVLRTVVRNT